MQGARPAGHGRLSRASIGSQRDLSASRSEPNVPYPIEFTDFSRVYANACFVGQAAGCKVVAEAGLF